MSDTFMGNPSFSLLAWQNYTGSDKFYLDVSFMSIGESPRMRLVTRCRIQKKRLDKNPYSGLKTHLLLNLRETHFQRPPKSKPKCFALKVNVFTFKPIGSNHFINCKVFHG
jgi:hypothetical protein